VTYKGEENFESIIKKLKEMKEKGDGRILEIPFVFRNLENEKEFKKLGLNEFVTYYPYNKEC
jgi:predicted CopG family antitoxin